MAKTERELKTGKGLNVERFFTRDGVHPYDQIEWETRDAVIPNYKDGGNAFEQRGVEFPTSWSMIATNIVAQKYFRGPQGTPQREHSVRQMVDRVADTITAWGWKDGYFDSEDSRDIFNAELKHLLVNQRAAFNSPVWFNVGAEAEPQCSACQPWDALVATPQGYLPIGRIVEQNLVGLEVFDSIGTTKVKAVKNNGEKPVFRVTLRNGAFIEATADHVVRAVQERRSETEWLRLDELRLGMRLHLLPHRASQGTGVATDLAISEAALAGWLQGDGFVGQYDHGTNQSLTIEFQVATSEEEAWVKEHLDVVFPDVHRKVRPIDSIPGFSRIRLYGERLRPFVERYGLLARRHDIRVPEPLWTAPSEVVAAYLRSVFQADGYMTVRGGSSRVGFAVISERWTEDLQILLGRLGIYSRRLRKAEVREDRSDLFEIAISYLSERRTFNEQVGFISMDKHDRLEASLELDGKSMGGLREEEIVRIESLGSMRVYDIQTESEHYLSNNIVVHNCFILAVEDKMSSILNWYVEEGTIFKGGSGSGINLSTIRSSKEQLTSGGEASGPVSFMRGADASAGTIKSGGKTRRAAKMVVLNVDHPDVSDFIWCKSREEHKARALRDAGFDMDLDGRDQYSIQYQNANNSVRVNDDFMRSVIDDGDWALRAVTDGRVVETVRGRDLMRQMALASWECADPGMQFDTTINDWHTSPNSGRINASNPCFPGDARVHTDKGLIRFDELIRRITSGETFGVYTDDRTNPDAPVETVTLSRPGQFMVTGVNEIVRLSFDDGRQLRCTPNHRIWTLNRGWVEAKDLTQEDEVAHLIGATPASMASWAMPVGAAHLRRTGDWSKTLVIPEKWDEEFAHYLGWLVGDGCVSGNVVTTVYGSEEDQREILPRHLEVITRLNGGSAPKPSVHANGTVQLRLSRRALTRFFLELGVTNGRAADKHVPWSVFEAPTEIQSAFLRGLFDADGCAVSLANGTRYVGLGSKSSELLGDVQRLLSALAIGSRIYDVTGNAARNFTYTRKGDGETVTYTSNGPSYDLRVFGRGRSRFEGSVGFSLSRKQEILRRCNAEHSTYSVHRPAHMQARVPDGFETTYNLTEPTNHSYIVDGSIVSNCSEYMHLDNSACNLASLNLMKFVDEHVNVDIPAFKHAVDIMFLAQEILVGNSSYPTAKIGQNARDFRELGLGYANLGALLMARGLAYDSEAGRAIAACITALMTGWAYRDSALFAEQVGPHAGYAVNREPMLRVIAKHRSAVDEIDTELAPEGLLQAAKNAWDEAIRLGEIHGYRNAQSTVLAPTGTIGLMMDCDTTGVEPDLALVKTKKLVGGGSMRIVNQTVPRALRRLGYSDEQINDITAYIFDNNDVHDAPHLAPEHYSIFDCAMGDRPIHYMGHVKMMAAVQPFISGAISKCVTGETLLATSDGLVRIGSLHDGEEADSFRDEFLEVDSVGGPQKTDAFYYGGVRPVREAILRSGHRVVGTPNHRLLVMTDTGTDWRRLDELQTGDLVAVKYGADLWSALPARFDSFEPSERYGNQKTITMPDEMNEELAFLLGAYVAEGHTTRSNWTVTITNSVPEVLERVARAWSFLFGCDARIDYRPDRCGQVIVSSKRIVEFLDYLGCGSRASEKRIPDAILRSPKLMVLAFLQGLSLDAYVTIDPMAKWALCVDSPGLLDDLQAVLTNLGIVHGRISKWNATYRKHYDEVYACGRHAQRLAEVVPFLEPDKADRAARLSARVIADEHATADVVPVLPRDLYEMLPRGRSGRGGSGVRAEFAYLCDPRTTRVTRRSLERVAAVPGVRLPSWLQMIVDDRMHLSPVASIEEAGSREVFDVSVPSTHAFVGNGIVNHNTVNMPESATVEDVEELLIESWKLGLKAVAIYRDNCKVAQPLSADKKVVASAPVPADGIGDAIRTPQRRRLPKSRVSRTTSFRVGDAEGYISAGMYDDGMLGEIFLKVSKQGSLLSGVMDALAISISLGLQYGVPLEAYVQKFMNARFDPAGMTDDPDVRFATSLVDYVFRRLALDHLDAEQRSRLGIMSTEEKRALVSGDHLSDRNGGAGAPQEAPAPIPMQSAPVPVDVASSAKVELEAIRLADAPMCYACGARMRPAGSCYVCEGCGSTSGCS